MGLVALLAAVTGAYAKQVQSSMKDKIDEHIEANQKEHEKFNDFEGKVRDHWEEDAKSYVTKEDFSSFTQDVKDSLIRIEDKLETLRDRS